MEYRVSFQKVYELQGFILEGLCLSIKGFRYQIKVGWWV